MEKGVRGFFVADSMLEKGLKGAELMIYALIHSFTKENGGMFFGGAEYIVLRTGYSLVTVKRALASLKKRGFVEKTNDASHLGLRTVPTKYDIECKNNCSEKYSDGELKAQYGEMLCDDPLDCGYPMLALGVYKNVIMSIPQYEKLSKTVNENILQGYLSRLSHITNEREKEGHPIPNNSYFIIRKWIHEDFGC